MTVPLCTVVRRVPVRRRLAIALALRRVRRRQRPRRDPFAVALVVAVVVFFATSVSLLVAALT